MVLAAEVGGLWSGETAKFLAALANAKAQASPFLDAACRRGLPSAELTPHGLTSTKKGQPICNDLRPPTICRVERHKVQVSHENVRGNPGASLTTRGSGLQSSARQRTQTSGGQTRHADGHIGMLFFCCKGKRETQSAQPTRLETVGVQTDESRRHTHERASNQRASLRMHIALLPPTMLGPTW